MNNRQLIAVCLSLVMGTEFVYSQAPTQPSSENSASSGKSLERPILKEDLQLRPFVYRPIDPEFWSKIEELERLRNYIEILIQGTARMNETTQGTPEFAEGKYATALALFHLDLVGAATYTFLQIAQEQIGTRVGEAALHYLGRLDAEKNTDRSAIEQVLVAGEFGPLHPHIQSFVSYHKGMYSLRYNLKWADDHFKKVTPDTYWGFERLYLSALSEISRGRADVGRKIIEQLYANKMTPAPLLKRMALQVARFKFEDEEFMAAIKIYDTLADAPVREKGRVLLERAWAQYYQKEYSKALGILKALEAPYFTSSLTFERHVLTMIIYKDLCYYGAVAQTAKVFRQAFSSALRDIKKRQRLVDNPILAQMALNHARLRDRANYIDQLRRESILFEQLGFKALPFYQQLLNYYENRDKELQLVLAHELEQKVHEIANELLDVEEQVQFIEYSAQLDSLRILREGENYRYYRPEQINYYGFDRIYWPVESEFWSDELDHYKVLSPSRCGDSNENYTQ